MEVLKKVFRGEVTPLILHFIENEDLLEKDIAELTQMFEKTVPMADLFWACWDVFIRFGLLALLLLS